MYQANVENCNFIHQKKFSNSELLALDEDPVFM